MGLKHSIDAHPDGAYWLDASNRFIYVNEAGCQALGYAREELLGQPVQMVAPAVTEERLQQVWEALRQDGFFHAESRHRRKDGREFPVEITASYVKYGGREFNCGFARDLTGRKQEEAKLREQTRELLARNDELTSFNQVAIGRELRMIELKREINELCGRLGQAPRPKMVEAQP